MIGKRLKPVWAYVCGIGAALAAGGLSALSSMSGMKEFAALDQPPLSPPGWLFPVVWCVLYVLMGISAARVYLANDARSSSALTLWAVQLAVNALWSPIFFSLELRLVAFVWLLGLIALTVYMISKFRSIDRTSGSLQIPYLVWLLFAAYLNMGVYLLNR